MHKFILVLTSLFFFIVNNALAVKSTTVGTGTFKSSAGQLTQAPLNFDIASLTWSAQNTISLSNPSGGSGSGAITFTSMTPAICSVLNNVVTAVSPGTCTIQATKAGDANYVSTSISSSNVIAAQSQPALTIISVTPSSVQPQATATVSVSGGGGSGNISLSSSNTNCTVNNLTVTAIRSGSCDLSATKAASGLFASATSTNSVSLTIAVTPDSGALSNSYPQWAYFNRTSNDSSSNASSANTLCATLGSGWRIPTYDETGPGTYVAWLDQNIGRGVQFFNSSGISNLQGAGWTTSYNYPYSSGFTINRIACYHP